MSPSPLRELQRWQDMTLEAGGRSLVEASAGTGKTWTISVLYLRLLLEQALDVRAIVVATFTDAAAQELRERLRARLRWAERLAGDTARAPTDPLPDDEVWLRARWRSEAARQRDLQRLRLALAELDLAPVTTLHGLCRRILAEHPVESGVAFELGELVASESLLDELASDAWRRLTQGAAEPMPPLKTLADLRQRLAVLLRPGVGLFRPGPGALQAALPADAVSRLRALAADASLFLPRKTAVKNAWLALADALEAEVPELSDTSRKNLDPDMLAEAVRPERLDALRADPLLLALPAILALLDYRLADAEIGAWQALMDTVRAWREQRCEQRAQLDFDALLERVHAALSRPDDRLAARLCEQWPVALVDEFQDTDAVQYGILDRLYRDADGGARGRLVMIGDPKQAIYRFRGGDIAAYLEARAQAQEHLVLGRNHRSARALVDALNQLHAVAGEALSTDPEHAVRYLPVTASARCDAAPYRVDGAPCAQPLAFHCAPLPCEDAAGQRRAALDACANHIVELLASGRHRIGEAALAPGDIAVLLPGNRDIAALRRRLQVRGVPCVGAGRASVFESDWARELQILLHALLHLHDDGAARAALATRLLGGGLARLEQLQREPEALEQALAELRRLQRLWRTRGVLGLVQALAATVAPALLADARGERDLTDLRHLGELLQAQSEHLAGPGELLAWLARQREGDADAGELAGAERQLRIESDAARVRLLTLHASKGLEFPIVLLPLLWANVGRRDAMPVLREPLAGGARVVGFGAQARARHEAEGQDERFRLLYVALTRAIHACHVYALPPDRPAKKGSSRPAADPQRAPLDALLARLPAAPDTAALAALTPAIAWRCGPWSWPRASLPSDVDATAAPRRSLPEPAEPAFEQRYSFSALVRHLAEPGEDAAADDEIALPESGLGADPIAPRAPHPELQALAGVRGTAFGNALHRALEQRVIGLPLSEQLGFVRSCLDDEGVRAPGLSAEQLAARVAARLDASLEAELLPGLRLGQVPPAAQRAEMGFHLLLGDPPVARLRAVCAAHGEPDLVPALAPSRLRGLLSGKIDLVFRHQGRFHVLDYKGNWLGEEGQLEDYAGASLAAAMQASHYRFQALIYVLALHRYLGQRLADYAYATHIGEAVYLFLRGAGLAPGAGVWTQRFDPALVAAVDAVLAGEEADA